VFHKSDAVVLLTACQWTVYLCCIECGSDISVCLVTGVTVYHLHRKVKATL
jgi:hypothetical protein